MVLEHIESRAELVLKRAGVDRLPVPVEEVAAKHHVRISRAPHSSLSGLLIRKESRALIGINSREAPARQRFTIAHELGHYFLHETKDAFVDYRDNASGIARSPREREANMFAAALLMPRRQLLKDCRALARDGILETEVATLARRYAVSEEAMRFRLINLNLLALGR